MIFQQDIPTISEPEDDDDDDDDDNDNVVANPTANIGLLASANFSTDSLNDTTIDSYADYYNNNSYNNSPRKYSNSSSNGSPTMQRTNSSNTRSRPLSAFLMDSSNAISEDGQPIVPIFNNTPRSRNSLTFGVRTPTNTTFTPPQLAAPMGQFRSSSPSRSSSPQRINKHYRSSSPVRRGSSPSKIANPFNFQSQELMYQNNNGSNQTLQVKPAHRKGHKYKHSSVSMNLFQEPPPASIGDVQLSAIPDSYPIPTFNETLSSITSNQKLRFSWSLFHLSVSVIIFVFGFKYKLSSLSTLAHLVFYDSLGSFLIVFVDIMSNFEVWNKPSIAYPFGLGRVEVLVGFALSTSLVMVGFDLFSHFLEEFIILWVSPENHDDHEHSSHHVHAEVDSQSANWVIYMFLLVGTAIVSLISSNYILAYDRINEMINSQENVAFSGNKPNSLLGDEKHSDELKKMKMVLEAWKNNPTHVITLTYTLFLILSPLIPQSLTSELAVDMNEIATILVAILLCYNGWKLVKTLGGILLCSFPYSDYDYNVLKANIVDQILSKDFFKQNYRIEKFFITKFNYKLFVIGMKIDMKGANSDEEVRMKFEVNRIICNELNNLDSSHTIPEITIDIDRF
ncbi:ZRG17 Protein ZRG17 [Candida maltosa Xu316]